MKKRDHSLRVKLPWIEAEGTGLGILGVVLIITMVMAAVWVFGRPGGHPRPGVNREVQEGLPHAAGLGEEPIGRYAAGVRGEAPRTTFALAKV
jgi:hypothetical protein